MSARSICVEARRLMRPDQVAVVFNVTARTVTYWARTGRLRSVRTPGGQYRFDPVDVDDLLSVDTSIRDSAALTAQTA